MSGEQELDCVECGRQLTIRDHHPTLCDSCTPGTRCEGCDGTGKVGGLYCDACDGCGRMNVDSWTE